MEKLTAISTAPPQSAQHFIEALRGYIEAAHSQNMTALEIRAIIAGEPRRISIGNV